MMDEAADMARLCSQQSAHGCPRQTDAARFDCPSIVPRITSTKILGLFGNDVLPFLRLAVKIFDLFQFAAELDEGVTDHAGIETKCSSHAMLCLGIRIEAQDEIVALMMNNACLADLVWEEEDAPVRDAAHDTASCKNLVASSLDDPDVC